MALRPILTIGAALLGLHIGGAASQGVAAETAAQFGSRICTSFMAGGFEDDVVDRYRLALAVAEQDEKHYCGCVALAFETNFAAQSERFSQSAADEETVMRDIIHENMGACLPDTSDMIDGDLVETAPLHLQPDIEGCLMVLDDALWPAGFDLTALRDKMRRGGLNAGDICSCTAERMREAHKQMNKKAADPEYSGSRWADHLGARMEDCAKNP